MLLRPMEPVKRRVVYRLYPTKGQQARLIEYLGLHCELYNAALEERRDAWRKKRLSVTKGMQEKQLQAVKEIRPEMKPLGGHALQETLRRVDLAYKAFFRRVKRGEAPEFPRFKPLNRFKGWTYKSKSKWALIPGKEGTHGRIKLDGIGKVRIRGVPRQMGEAKTLTITRKRDRWYASVVFECPPVRAHGAEEHGFDWGIESFVTLDTGERIENPRLLVGAESKLVTLQRGVLKKKRESKNRKKAVARLAAAHEKIANKRTDFLHQESARLVGRSRLLAGEKLAVRNMTRSARGTIETPGFNVRQKAGLNRRILDGAPSAFLGMVRYKAEEAGCELHEIPTRTVKPSQTCPACGAVRKKALSERVHSCPCGCHMPRDQASSQVCLKYVQRVGNRPRAGGKAVASPANHETASESAA